MNKTEKKLAEKLLAFFNSPAKTDSGFTREENSILERWLVHGILNVNAFTDMTPMNSDHKEYGQVLNYPFTHLGEDEFKKNWYLRFRDCIVIIIVRDALTVIAFLVSLWLAISSLTQK